MTDERSSKDFDIEQIFLKDLSFETPMGRDVFSNEWKPAYDVSLESSSGSLADNLWQVVLTVTVTAMLENNTAFLIEAHQAGVIRVREMDKEALRRVLAIDAPRWIFPYLREVVDNVAAKGGFPSVRLQQPDFEDWYEHANQPEASADNKT